MKATITYEVITQESAEHGDVEEHGWWLPGGWEHALSDALGDHPELLREAQSGAFDLELGDAIRAALDLGCCEVSPGERSISVRSVDPLGDRRYMEDGEERFFTLHVNGISPGTVARIAGIFGG